MTNLKNVDNRSAVCEVMGKSVLTHFYASLWPLTRFCAILYVLVRVLEFY